MAKFTKQEVSALFRSPIRAGVDGLHRVPFVRWRFVADVARRDFAGWRHNCRSWV